MSFSAEVWKRLDLRKSEQRPAEGQLVALRMIPNNTRATFYCGDRYDIGFLKPDSRSNSKKLWWNGTRGCNDPARLKQHFDIWWCSVKEFDGI